MAVQGRILEYNIGKLNKAIDSGNAGGHVPSEFACGVRSNDDVLW